MSSRYRLGVETPHGTFHPNVIFDTQGTLALNEENDFPEAVPICMVYDIPQNVRLEDIDPVKYKHGLETARKIVRCLNTCEDEEGK